MKKIFTIASVLGLGLLIAFSCKKSSTTTTPPANNNNTNTVPTTMNLTVNGTAATNMSAGSFSNTASSSYIVTFMDGSGYPQVQLKFGGTTFPASGTYTIVTISGTTTPPAGKCGFVLTPSAGSLATASSGVVTVAAAATPSNTAYFTNIICTTGPNTYTVSGAAKY